MASDTHLTSNDPGGVDTFVRFLRGPCRSADRVLLLGDLFDFWVSSSQRHDPGLAPVFEALEDLSAGREVGFIEGNRDFAAARTMPGLGVRPLPDVHQFEQDGRRFVFAHGDQFCTRDVRYQAFRRLVRADVTRHVAELAPDRWAVSAGRGARKKSQSETARKNYDDMGLVPRRVAAFLRDRDADTLVCGHVHWGRRYRIEVDGRDRDLVVLSAWEDRGSYAWIEGGEAAFHWFD